MKRVLFLAILFVFSVFALVAQRKYNTFIQRVSLDASVAYIHPVSLYEGFNGSDFLGFRSLSVGSSYALNNLWGMRMSYGLNSFKDKDYTSKGFTIHKFMVEATFNILQCIVPKDNPFNIVAHTGAGMSLGVSSLSDDIDKMGTIQAGIMPMYRISNNLSLLLDATYVVNYHQNYNYNGEKAYEDFRHVTGKFFSFNLGVGLRLGF